MRSDLPDLANPDDDPWLWLEGVDDPRALAWADAQTAGTLARLDSPAFRADRDALRALLDRPDNLPGVTRRGGLLYNFWRDAAHPRRLWRRTTLDCYRQPDPGWDILLDLDALAATEGEDCVVAGHKGQPAAVARRGGLGGAAGWQARRDAARWRRTSRRSPAWSSVGAR